jgi:hypothetical protein
MGGVNFPDLIRPPRKWQEFLPKRFIMEGCWRGESKNCVRINVIYTQIT